MVTTYLPWTLLLVVTVATAVVLRGRWKNFSILVRCILLSIYAHLLFATAAYTTQFTNWDVGPGSGNGGSQPIRVRMTSESPHSVSDDVSPSELPPWESVGEIPHEVALPIANEADRALNPPAFTPEPIEEAATKAAPAMQELSAIPSETSLFESVAEVLAEVAPRYADAVAMETKPKPELVESMSTEANPAPASASLQTIASTTPPPQAAQTTSTPASTSHVPSPLTPEVYKLRFADNRSEILAAAGGSVDTEAAVELALAWLVANQEADGHWGAAKHGAGRGLPQQGQNRGDTGADADTGITALALLALMGDGHTHLEGQHRVAVQRGLEFLLASQRADGCLAGQAKLFATMYCHGMASLALAEAMAITRDARLRPFVERAIAYSVKAQHSGGGWRYQPGDVGDMSQFGWQIMSLKSAELAGINVPGITKQRAQTFLKTMSSGRSGGLASYRAGERASRTMTAEALLCRYLLEATPTSATRDEADWFLLEELPSNSPANVYYWYYGTLAMRFSGGAAWTKWNGALQTKLLATQRHDSHTVGSWDPDTVWGGYGGRVYQTSLSALCLEAYYRYDTASLESGILR